METPTTQNPEQVEEQPVEEQPVKQPKAKKSWPWYLLAIVIALIVGGAIMYWFVAKPAIDKKAATEQTAAEQTDQADAYYQDYLAQKKLAEDCEKEKAAMANDLEKAKKEAEEALAKGSGKNKPR